jgi:hypothetical protein
VFSSKAGIRTALQLLYNHDRWARSMRVQMRLMEKAEAKRQRRKAKAKRAERSRRK